MRNNSGHRILLLLAWAALLFAGGCVREDAETHDPPALQTTNADASAITDHDLDAQGEQEDHDHAAQEDHDHAAQEETDHSDHDHDADEIDDHTSDEDHDDGAAERSFLPLDRSAAAGLGIEVQPVAPVHHFDQIKIPGLLTVDPDRQVEISAPAMVRVVALDALPPAAVRPGERLAVLELADPGIRDLQVQAVATRAELLEAVTLRNRSREYLRALQTRGDEVTAERQRVDADLQIQEARARAQRSSLDALLASLKVAGLSSAQLTALENDGQVTTRIEVVAPDLPGSPSLEVADRPISLGETVAAGSPLFSLVALDRLRVVGEAFESDLPAVRRALRDDLPVALLFPAEDRVVSNLHIMAIEGALDGVNRVTHFFVLLFNRLLSERVAGGFRYQDWEHRAGSRVQILVATQEVGRRYVIPSSSLVREGGCAWVFVSAGGGYDRLHVDIESLEGRRAVLSLECGLRPGDELVVRGALQLNLIYKESQGGGAASPDPHAGHSH